MLFELVPTDELLVEEPVVTELFLVLFELVPTDELLVEELVVTEMLLVLPELFPTVAELLVLLFERFAVELFLEALSVLVAFDLVALPVFIVERVWFRAYEFLTPSFLLAKD